VEAGTLLAASSLLFGVHVLGSVWALAGLWLCGLVAFFGLAVLLGSRTDRPSIGQGLINAATLPMFLVSGIFFSLDNFPPALASVFRAFPPTLLVDGTRAVMGGGGGWPEVALPCLVLLATGAACFAVGKRIFRFH
jgi:ABC-type multidrug transport system permease subunit